MTVDVLAIHVMKTAGTSLRRMMVDAAGDDAVYPNDADLNALPKSRYPSPAAYPRLVREGHHHGARVLIGHVPYVLAEALTPRPLTVALLRDPVARAVSMLEHRRRRSRRFAGASLAQVLDDDRVVEEHLRDYQTRMFAFDSLGECAERINTPLEIDDARFQRALRRLESVDVLGVVERLPQALSRLEAVTGIPARELPHANQARYREPVSDEVRRRLEPLLVRDQVLYQRARELADAPGARA